MAKNFIEIEIGDSIVMIEHVHNGLIHLRPFDTGRIIHRQNQVEASVWFRQIGQYASEPLSTVLNLDTSYGKNGRLDGVSVRLKRKSFALKFDPFGKFDGYVVNETEAMTIPFFQPDETDTYRSPSNMTIQVNGKMMPVYRYSLQYLINVVSDGFAEWVKANAKARKIRQSEKENGDYPSDWDTCLTEESSTLFHEKKREVEWAFAKATGVFYEFTGGLLMD